MPIHGPEKTPQCVTILKLFKDIQKIVCEADV